MKAVVKVGRKEGFVSSYNLFFENGLRLRTEDLVFFAADQKAKIEAQFAEVVTALRAAGIGIEEPKEQ